MSCFCTTACTWRLARRSFLALHTRINEPVIGVAFHGRHAKHLQAHHFKDGLQLTQLSGHYSSHQGAQGRRRRGAANPILHRDFREHAAIVFVRQLISPVKQKARATRLRSTAVVRERRLLTARQRPNRTWSFYFSHSAFCSRGATSWPCP